METFSALLAICAGNSLVIGEFPTQRPVTRSFDVFFHLRLNKQLSKQSWGWWFETPSRPLWRHCNAWCCIEYIPWNMHMICALSCSVMDCCRERLLHFAHRKTVVLITVNFDDYSSMPFSTFQKREGKMVFCIMVYARKTIALHDDDSAPGNRMLHACHGEI